jgi:poly-gamma-glutamate synthesis protein (capsule biosynthesis protein)
MRLTQRLPAVVLPLAAVLAPLLLPGSCTAAVARGTTIEDFESGSVVLRSYPDQDHDPDAWEVTSSNAHAGVYALRIHGNSWKIQDIPPVAIADSTVWQVAVYAEDLGEMQAFGIGDGTNELLYTMAGEQLPQGDKWWTVYQGAFPVEEWYAYLLPIGRDWFVTHGYYPTITELIYVNDDDQNPRGTTVFDEIVDVTEDLPVAPIADILYTIESSKWITGKLLHVSVQFYSQVFDPDSPTHTFAWDFGDSTFSSEQDPLHDFFVTADYTYTVGLVAKDEIGLAGNDTCQVRVTAGTGELPLTINFVGDIFTGRRYEEPGGIIERFGIEALYEPTLSIFGEAADVSVCNLECSYTDRGTPHPTKSVVFRSHPDNIVGVQYAGIDMVDIGNNHIIDYGEIGMLDTMELLDGLDIPYSGAGTSSYFALQPTFWTEKGVRMALLGQSNRCGRTWNYQPFLDAGYNKPGFGYLLPHNIESAISDTRDLADIVIIQMHSGDGYETAPPPDGLGFTTPPPVEADAISPDDPDFRFKVEPTASDRQLRRLAADLGADVVINHHPHVLQGFESHNGKLIAHSLGNFIFDLYYPETMPTMVLTLEIDKEGIVGHRFVPAWIDDYIPQPATGQLGREIMDRVADYSRPMDALVSVRPEENAARIYLSRESADSTVTSGEAMADLIEESGQWLSPPLELAGQGNLSQITSIGGGGASGWEISWGREILWHGGFEAEGATLWDDNTEDEWLDDTEAHSGRRSLALRRDDRDQGEVGTDLERHLPCNPDARHSFTGYLKADNAAETRMMARFYSPIGPSSGRSLRPRRMGTTSRCAAPTSHRRRAPVTPGSMRSSSSNGSPGFRPIVPSPFPHPTTTASCRCGALTPERSPSLSPTRRPPTTAPQPRHRARRLRHAPPCS